MPFADMTSAKYATGMASDAKFRVGGIGEGENIRIIAKVPDQVVTDDGVRFVTSGYVFKLQVAEVAAPAVGDTIEWDAGVYAIQSEPVRVGRLGLEWQLDMVPA